MGGPDDYEEGHTLVPGGVTLRLVRVFVCLGAVTYAAAAPAFFDPPVWLNWVILLGEPGREGREAVPYQPAVPERRVQRTRTQYVPMWIRRNNFIGYLIGSGWTRNSLSARVFETREAAESVFRFINVGASIGVPACREGETRRTTSPVAVDPHPGAVVRSPGGFVIVSGFFLRCDFVEVIPARPEVLGREAVEAIPPSGIYEYPPIVRFGVSANIMIALLWAGFGVARKVLSPKVWAADMVDGRVAAGQTTAWQKRMR